MSPRELPGPFTFLVLFAGALLFWCVMVLVYWPFVHQVLKGDKKTSLRTAALIQVICLVVELVVYGAIGAIVFEHLFDQSQQLLAKVFYHSLVAVLATIVSMVIIRTRRLTAIVWLWAGNELLALLVLLATLPVEM